MGIVLNSFLLRRWAQRYAEIYLTKGEFLAETYAAEHIDQKKILNMELFEGLVVQELRRQKLKIEKNRSNRPPDGNQPA